MFVTVNSSQVIYDIALLYVPRLILLLVQVIWEVLHWEVSQADLQVGAGVSGSARERSHHTLSIWSREQKYGHVSFYFTHLYRHHLSTSVLVISFRSRQSCIATLEAVEV